MEVRKIENPVGTLIRLEFNQTGGEVFKEALISWVQTNYPDWGYEGFFQRLSVFQATHCAIDMQGDGGG